MAEFFTNNYQTTLNDSGGISNVDSSLIVTSATGAPAATFRIKIDDELILVGAKSGTTFSTLTRGIEGTAAASHTDGSTVTHVLTAATVTASAHEAWTTYTPTWTASTTNPTLGSTTITGRYKKLDANTVAVQINILITTGGAWNAGSGTYAFSLPSGMTGIARHQIGAMHIRDSGTVHYTAVCSVRSGATTIGETYVADSTGTHLMTNTLPMTPATNDEYNLSILVEIT